MQELRELARRLLQEKRVDAIIGYENDRRGVRPTFVTEAAECERLIFDHRCVHNLATYLSPRRTDVAALGRLAAVTKPCDACAVAGLIRESQLSSITAFQFHPLRYPGLPEPFSSHCEHAF